MMPRQFLSSAAALARAAVLSAVLAAPSFAAEEKDPRPVDPAAAGKEAVAGVLLDGDGTPVSGALVFVCDAATGVPVSTVTLRPFSEGGYGSFPKRFAHARTDDRGGFRVDRLKPGTYRLV